jgi:ribosome biogenesis GTPase / thiamine phosphate phosphatase
LKKGLVRKIVSNAYTVVDHETGEDVLCSASGKLRHVRVSDVEAYGNRQTDRTKKETGIVQMSPKVGDHVNYDVTDGHAVIRTIMERENALDRPDVANVGQVLLVFSAVRPDFSFSLFDKFLVILSMRKIRPVTVITKTGLAGQDTLLGLKKELSYYEGIGYPVHYVDSKTHHGFESLSGVFKDRITVLAGQTGVGKSTLINALIPGLELNTQDISKALGRGKHTTRHTELYPFQGGYVCDTPGFSKVAFDLLSPEEIKAHYPDFERLSEGCRFGHSCLHANEPGCAVIHAVKEGLLPQDRHARYLQFLDETKTRKRVY